MDEAARNRLFEDYAKNRSPEIREQIILEYAPLVKLVAGRLSMYLGYNVEYDDLVGYGVFGLIDAIDKYDNMKAVKLKPMPASGSGEQYWIRSGKWTGSRERSVRNRKK